MAEEKTFDAKHYEAELKFMLDHEKGRTFLMRLVHEGCHVYQTSFPMNAGAYALLAKQEIGKKILNFARQIDLEKVHMAEREYFKVLETHRKEEQQKNEADQPFDFDKY